ncbi:CAMK/CAMKL/MARK protein kinase [Phakopsora pachyrhizi]|nr:CAMK/CAMKL/MARK protein kinase [Phakopsora pachyrhizi]
MIRSRYHPGQQSNSSGEKAQLVLAYQELGKELHSTQLKVIGNYTLGKVIGQGDFGTVRMGVHRLTGCRVAIKSIPKSSSPPLLTREIHHHRRLRHPNVVQLYEVIATEHTIWLITELCPGGELFDYLVENTRFTESEARRIFGQVCLGLGYVHHQGVVHRDLKLENVLLDERCNPKLADFGFGREFEPRRLLDTFCGTTGYAAPEMLAGRKYLGQEVDIWSLGIILHSLLTGSLPFDDDDEEVMKSMIIAGEFDVPSFLSINASDLIKSILQQDPKARPSIDKILSHSWFTVPPSQHIFLDDPVLRPPTIAEEGPNLCDSPLIQKPLDGLDHSVMETSSGAHPRDSDSDPTSKLAASSDTSESSCRASDLGIGSSRSSTSSPDTPEDFPTRFSGIPDLAASFTAFSPLSQSHDASYSSFHVKPTRDSQALHRNNSNSTIKDESLPPIDLTHSQIDRLTVHNESTEAETDSLSSQARHSLTIKIPDSETSSNISVTSKKGSNSKRRPPSLGPCLPSGVSLPQVRTPSRTKRRSIGSVMAERIGPIDEFSIQSELPTPTGGNPSRLSASSLNAVVIDYLGALKATMTKTSLMSENDLGLLKSLSTLGFDTGQVIHSVQSNACDSSGAMWWLLKRKMDRLAADKELSEKFSNRLSNSNSIKQGSSESRPVSEYLFSSPHPTAKESPLNPVSNPERPSSFSTPGALVPPTSTPIVSSPLRSFEHSGECKRKSSSEKQKSLTLSPQVIDSPLNPVSNQRGTIDGAQFATPPGSQSSLGKKRVQVITNRYSGVLRDDAQSSTSSLKADTSSDKDSSGPPNLTTSDPSRKVTPERRKRSQSVSMLQRATHALAPKKSTEEKNSKSRGKEVSSNLEIDHTEKVLKTPKKDHRSREKDVKAQEETSKSSSPSINLSLLFSRKVILLPPLPPLPSSIVLGHLSGDHDRGSEREDNKSKELKVPETDRSSVSMPSNLSRQSPNNTVSPKASRSKSNLFSSFRLWFNEDRRKRKRNIPLVPVYSSLNTNSARSPRSRGNFSANEPGNLNQSALSGVGVAGAEKGVYDSTLVRPGTTANAPMHRRSSKGSRRSSMQSNPRQRSNEFVNSRVGRKRRSDSSRASLGSCAGNRTPTSDKGSLNSASQHHVSSRTPSEGPSSRRRPGHLRQASTGSTGSRKSNILTPHNPSGHPGFGRRTSSHGTTVRRITTTVATTGKSRQRNSRTFSSSSSARTSMSSDEGSGSVIRSLNGHEEHLIHSPINAYDVEATIEEEEDDGEIGAESSFGNSSIVKIPADEEIQTRDARRYALEKLSGDGSEKLSSGTEKGKNESNVANSVSRTIFMAHKPHSVFGTPTQAFFGRSVHSPLTSKLINHIGGISSGTVNTNYTNLMKSVAEGPQPGKQRKFRDVFASKAAEDGEWIDMDEDDDVCSRYGGGLGQSVQNRREEGMSLSGDSRKLKRGEELMSKPVLTTGEVIKKMVNLNQDSQKTLASPGNISGNSISKVENNSNSGDRQAGVGGRVQPQQQQHPSSLIGNWRGGNHRGLSNFKSLSIEEEEEEEEEEED